MSENAVSPGPSHSASSRIPGASRRRAPPGRRREIAARRRVAAAAVRGPGLSDGLYSACRSSRFTSVDFPTPDMPSSACVRPGARRAASAASAGARHRAHGVNVGARRRAGFRDALFDLRAHVRFREHDERKRLALPGERRVALESARVEVAVERHRDEEHVHVGRENLRPAPRPPRPCARCRLRRGITAMDEAASAPTDGRSTTQSPTAGRSNRLEAASYRSRPAHLREALAVFRHDEVRSALLTQNARRNEPLRGEGREPRFEKR